MWLISIRAQRDSQTNPTILTKHSTTSSETQLSSLISMRANLDGYRLLISTASHPLWPPNWIQNKILSGKVKSNTILKSPRIKLQGLKQISNKRMLMIPLGNSIVLQVKSVKSQCHGSLMRNHRSKTVNVFRVLNTKASQPNYPPTWISTKGKSLMTLKPPKRTS